MFIPMSALLVIAIGFVLERWLAAHIPPDAQDRAHAAWKAERRQLRQDVKALMKHVRRLAWKQGFLTYLRFCNSLQQCEWNVYARRDFLKAWEASLLAAA